MKGGINMAFSYSFHLSAKSHSVGTTGKINQCSRHNLREYKSNKYDRTQIDIIRGSDNSILDNVKKIYKEEFNECLVKYNQGKRADRQIQDYLEHVSNSRSDAAAEIIIQVGDREFWKNKTLSDKKKMNYIFRDQLRSLEKLCPEFKIASAVVHYDESSPHMHIVGVPVASGYKKGMEKQVAKTKVFTADRLSYLQDKMRANAERGMELNPELFRDQRLKEKEKGRNKDIPKAMLDDYYELKNEAEKLQKATKFYKKQKNISEEQFQKVNAELRLIKDEREEEQDKLKNIKEVLIPKAQDELKNINEVLIPEAQDELKNIKEVQIPDAQEELKKINEVQLPEARRELISAQISVKEAQDGVTALKKEKELLEGNITDLKEEITDLKGEIKDLKIEVSQWQNSLDILKNKVVSILNSAAETFKKIIKLHTKGLPEDKGIELTDETKEKHNEQIDQLEVKETIKDKSKSIIAENAEEVKEYIRPRRRGR